MNVQTSKCYKVLDQSNNSVFFEKPKQIQINEEVVTRYATSQKIEVLIEELKEKGPLIAMGKLGPNSYIDAPFKLKDKVCENDIYGWKAGSTRIDNSGQSSLLILGAKKNADQEYVYYTLSQDVTTNTTSYLRQHRPSMTDSKVYIVSHKTFSNYLFDLYPPHSKTSETSKSAQASIAASFISVNEYAKTLSEIMPLNSILDRGEGEKKCKEIGQKAFDEFKKNANGNSWAAKEAVQNICNLIKSIASDGFLRKQYVERAWDGIGDENWRWMA